MTACWCLKMSSFIHVATTACAACISQSTFILVSPLLTKSTVPRSAPLLTIQLSRAKTWCICSLHWHGSKNRNVRSSPAPFFDYQNANTPARVPLSFLHVVVRGSAKQQARATAAHEALSPGDPDVTAVWPTSTTSLAGDFRSYLGELFLSNKLSGLDTRELTSRATSAGTRSVKRTAQTGASGRCPGNISRDLMRNLIRNCKMPSLYFADIPVWDFKRGQAMTCDVPFLLVREVLTALASKSSDFVEQCSSLPYLPALDEEIAVFLSSRWRWP